MCMFLDLPPKGNTKIPRTKPRWAYKAFHRNSPTTLTFTNQTNHPVELNKWMKAQTQTYMPDEKLNLYGFHVFLTQAGARAYNRSGYPYTTNNNTVIRVKVSGTIFGTGLFNDKHKGMRVSHIFVPFKPKPKAKA